MQHSRNPDVDAIARLATDDVVAIDARCSLPDDFKIARLFQWRVFRQRQFGSSRGESAVLKAAAGRSMNDGAMGSYATGAIDFPVRRRCGSEHLASGRSGLSQGFPTAPQAIAA